MNKLKFPRIRRAAATGKDQDMDNTQTQHIGRPIACLGDQAGIDI